MVRVNKLLGEGVGNIVKMHSREMRKRDRDWNYKTQQKIFCENLKSNGYDVTVSGSYVSATRNNETVRFYFSAHSPQNKNYLVSSVLENRVDYFAFYNNKTDVVYLVGYGIIREYCKNLKTGFVFSNNGQNVKLFIPDEWAQQQKINTLLLY